MPMFLPRPGRRIFFKPTVTPTTWFGSSSVAITVTVTSAGTRQTFGVASVALVVTTVSAGIRKTFATAAVALVVAVTSAGIRKTFGSPTVTILVTVTTNGVDTSTGPAPNTGAGGAGLTVTHIHPRDILENAAWQAQVDNEEIALILSLL